MNADFLREVDRRVIVLDGAMGTSIHSHNLPLSEYRGLENCCEILVETRPDVIREIHESFLAVGCDAVETNTFGANQIVLAEFGIAHLTRDLNARAASIARAATAKHATPERPRFVLGSIGPGTKLPSLGHVAYDVLLASYSEQIRGLLDGGVDALIIETCQDILQCKCALAAALRVFDERGTRLPLIVQVTMETTGTMLVGSDMGAAVTALDPFPIDVIGLNCATGPAEMSEHIKYLSKYCPRRLSVVPNAGLPQLIDGCAAYPLSPEEMALWIKRFVEEDGVNIVGGCCGTTPAHLKAVVAAIGTRAPAPRAVSHQPAASSLYNTVTLRQDNSMLIIGERTNANGSKQFKELLEKGDLDGMVQMAKRQVKEGSHVIDVCTAYVGRDETADMRAVIRRFASEVTVPLMIDSTEAPVIEEALKMHGGKCLVNSVNLEDGEERCAKVLPMCKQYGAAVVALTIDEQGMAKTAARKLEVARRLYDIIVDKYGLKPSDILFDPLTFTICTGNEDDRKLGEETLAGIRLIKQAMPQAHTMLGLSNISFGLLPAARSVLNSVFLHHARASGLDAAIVHASKIVPLYKIDERQRQVAEDLIFDRRREGYDPLQELIALFLDHKVEKKVERKARSVEERLQSRIVDGDRKGLEDDLKLALETHRPLDIINNLLLEGMKVVGELFASGAMQLPFVLQSAETMKAAVNFLEPFMEKLAGESKGKIVLATVKGDVHDIGKNLVDIILTNNGYAVINLGIKQPIHNILDAAKNHAADAIGMSGLLVKSTLVMKDNLDEMNRQGIKLPVILGGAALTRRYVEKDLRALYQGHVDYAKDAFEGLALMEQICGRARTSPARAEPAKVLVGAAARNGGTPPPALDEVRAKSIAERPAPEVNIALKAHTDVARNVPLPQVPFFGTRVVDRVPLRALLPFLNEVMLFQFQWGFKKSARTSADFEAYLDEHARPALQRMLQECEAAPILEPRAVYGFYPCYAQGDEVVLLDPDKHTESARFRFPRQADRARLCIADFFRPKETGDLDVIGLQIVTMGARADEVARSWFHQNRYTDYLFLHGFSVEMTEAFAEYMHKLIRSDLGLLGDDVRDMKELLRQGYRGSRYSFGYPACPKLEDQEKLLRLLRAERIGISLSEEYQLIPQQSTSAIIAHHPQAKYFSV
ncbi:MAG: methionine synthase [Planctomycetota bacterium]